MITYQSNNITFVYRVAAVITDADRVLLHRAEHHPFWSLPGGKVDMLETSTHAVRREIEEELGECIAIDRLLWTVENFFQDGNESFHELGLYYLTHLQPGSRFLQDEGPYEGVEHFEGSYSPENPLKLIFQWFPLNPGKLASETIYPVFLRKGLAELPKSITPVINIEKDTD